MNKALLSLLFLVVSQANAKTVYEFRETRKLVSLVNKAAKQIQKKGEGSFEDFRKEKSKWRHGDTYVFVLNLEGDMLLHPDPMIEGKDKIGLKDINGRPIIRGLIEAATASPNKTEGWYHYQWPTPGEILPRWKSSFVQLVKAPSGQSYIVGSGIYNDRMEKTFVVDAVKDAVLEIEKKGKSAFPEFHDQTGRFMNKDAYIFVIDQKGTDLVNPGFKNLEGRNIIDVKDARGKLLVREMLKVAEEKGEGWVDYQWPKPGDNVATLKSTYVMKAKNGDQWLLVGCGVYLSNAPKAARAINEMTAPKLVQLVNDGAMMLEKKGEAAFSEFRKKESIWFSGDTYFFVWDMNGNRRFHAADPDLEGKNGRDEKDVLGRPYGKMFLEIASSKSGEGWAHYMYPQPGQIFPTWKSVYLKRIIFPNGQKQLIGCGSYHMQMDKTLIEDQVNRAAELVKEKGKASFAELRDKKGPYYYMDTYVFVDSPDGVELVNPAQPSLEGKNISNLKDAKGKMVAKDYIDAAMKNNTQWVEYHWYRPGSNTPTLKRTFVRKVEHDKDTYIIGSGLYVEEGMKLTQKGMGSSGAKY